MCKNPKNDKGFDVKEFHNWRHVIGCRNENPDQSLELYICEDCGAVLLRKWGQEMIINHGSDSPKAPANMELIAGGLKFDEIWGAWEEF